MRDRKDWTMFLAAVAGGCLLWSSGDSPSGRHEPWDAENQLPYLLAQGLLGGMFALLEPRGFWRWPLGIYVGQAIGLAQSSLSHGAILDPLILVGLAFLLPYTTPACVGAAAGAAYVRSRGGSAEAHERR